MGMEVGKRAFGNPPSNMMATGGKISLTPSGWVLDFERSTYGRLLRIDGRVPARVRISSWESLPPGVHPTAPMLGGFDHPVTKRYTFPAGIPPAWHVAVRGG